jgi:hypothetical protein
MLHWWHAGQMVSHVAAIRDYAGPYPFFDEQGLPAEPEIISYRLRLVQCRTISRFRQLHADRVSGKVTYGGAEFVLVEKIGPGSITGGTEVLSLAPFPSLFPSGSFLIGHGYLLTQEELLDKFNIYGNSVSSDLAHCSVQRRKALGCITHLVSSIFSGEIHHDSIS